MFKHVKDKNVIRNTQHGFTKSKVHLPSLTAFCEEMTGYVGEEMVLEVTWCY